MPLPERLYTLVLGAARHALPLLSRGEGKLARGIRGRRGVVGRMEAWAAAERAPERPLVWFTAPSVGEGLQARAVIEALRARRPEVQIAYSFFSPSAEAFARTLPVDFADYLPVDLPREAVRALEALRPDVLVFTKTEVWPVLSREAASRGVRMALLSATLPASSSRLSRPARAFLASAHRRLDRVGAISAEDAARYAALGVPEERRTVTGDARFDQVWARAAGVDRGSPLLRLLARLPRPLLVAGSTWPADEERLLPAVRRLRAEGTGVGLVLVPHEPTPAHLRESLARLRALGFGARLLSQAEASAEAPPDEVLLVDRVGVLGVLYAAAELAYVGGGFGRAGLHSVLEPAAFGVPALFGPRHGNAREAAELIARGGGFAAEDADALFRRLSELLLRDEGTRHAAGDAARRYVEAGRGAAARGAEVVEALLTR